LFLVFGVFSLFVLSCFFTLGIAAFFREPERVCPDVEGSSVLSPADGVVVDVVPSATPPEELSLYAEGSWSRVSIFLSIFDVHVNRIPCSGRVLMTRYHKGQFFNASLDKASELNERNSLVIENKGTDKRVIVVQIAGLIARRILCDVQVGDDVVMGQTYGIIRFGSRVDVYVHHTAKIHVKLGQRMVGGETILATL
jgi:phosphatidylserine decarboxylase